MAVREGLLALLDGGERYGYQLKTEFEAATGGVWNLNVGQVYTTLDRLHRDGLVEVREHDEQKSYRLTPAGVTELGNWWEAVPAENPPPRDELMLKVLMAIERGTERALPVITHQRTVLYGLLQRHRRDRIPVGDLDADAEPETVAAALVTDALVVRAEADLRWLDLCEARIIASPQPSAPSASPVPPSSAPPSSAPPFITTS